jgi:hypothetical protein
MGDTLEDIARALSVSASDLRDRNSKNIADFSRLNGRFVQICDIGSKCADFALNVTAGRVMVLLLRQALRKADLHPASL